MTTDEPVWTLSDCDAMIAKLTSIEVNGVARARKMQREIDSLRASLFMCAKEEESHKIALLASYDAEMARVCALPGVMNALYGDEVIP